MKRGFVKIEKQQHYRNSLGSRMGNDRHDQNADDFYFTRPYAVSGKGPLWVWRGNIGKAKPKMLSKGR